MRHSMPHNVLVNGGPRDKAVDMARRLRPVRST
jgi:hypothetical protein